MISIDKNRRLVEMASKLRDDRALARIVDETGEIPADHSLGYKVRDFIRGRTYAVGLLNVGDFGGIFHNGA